MYHRKLIALVTVCALAVPAAADVYVLANRTATDVALRVSSETKLPYAVSIVSGEVRPLLSDEQLTVTLPGVGGPQAYRLDANACYFIGQSQDGSMRLQKIGLGGDAETARGRALPGAAEDESIKTIDVVLLVDEEEPLRREIWEQKLRRRLESASRIIEQHSGIRFRTVAVGRWESDNSKRKFTESLAEFEREVKPGRGKLAIGFTNQYETPRGRIHLGGTRGPLTSHILLREWTKHVSETERMELLLHELGHYLGATHSPEVDSVMRPVLGDRKSRRKDFVVKFDPVNTLIMSMIGEEMRRGGATALADLTPDTRKRLAQIYKEVGRAAPNDQTSRALARIAGSPPPRRVVSRRGARDDGVAQLLGALREAAGRNGQQPPIYKQTGDRLTDFYVRVTANAAKQLPRDSRDKSFLLAMAIGLDDTGALAKLPLTRGIAKRAETPDQRRARLFALGDPTVHGREDLVKHFFVSAALTATASGMFADGTGILKETLDAQGGSGFSFADIAANRAGIRFAERLLDGAIDVSQLADSFSLAEYVPSIDGLPEGMQQEEFKNLFGSPGDERFKEELAEVDRRVDALEIYQNP